MNWARSYSSTWRVFRVNRDTWADGAEVSCVDEFSIEKTADGDLLESGSMTVTDGLDNDYYRVVLTAEQDGEVVRVEIATLLFDVASGTYNYGTSTHSASGYSVLYPASTTAILRGSYAPGGVNGAEYAAAMLRDAINAPVVVEGSFTLNDYVVHELGSTVLECVWAVLNAGNFTMQIDGHGTVHILPMPSKAELNLDSLNAQLVMPGIDYEADDSGVPNRYIAQVGNLTEMAVNDLANKVSTSTRGYFVDYLDTEPIPVNGETLKAYCVRKLHEMSTIADTRTYTREFAPDVSIYDVVDASLDGMSGTMRVTAQSLTCNYGVTVTEKATKEIDLWQ